MTQLRIALVARDVARQARVAARWKGATLTAVATDPLYPLRTDGLPPTLWTGDAGDLFRSGTVEFDAVLAADLAHWTVEVLAKQAAASKGG